MSCCLEVDRAGNAGRYSARAPGVPRSLIRQECSLLLALGKVVGMSSLSFRRSDPGELV